MLVGIIIGMIIFAQPILDLLYPRANEGALLLQIISISVIFSILDQTINDDNKNFYFDQDGICGCIQNYNGMLQVVVDRDLSLMNNGFIDDSTGKLYVNFVEDSSK